MNAVTAILAAVEAAGKIDRDALIAEIERTHDPKVVSSSVSTLIRRGELQELPSGHIALGDESVREKSEAERQARKVERDRPAPLPPTTSTQVAPVASTPRKGSTSSAVAICSAIQHAVSKYGPMRAADIARHVPDVTGSNIYHHTGEMTKRGELLKRGALYAVSVEQFNARLPPEPDLSAETPTAPDVDVAGAVSQVKEESQLMAPAAPDTTLTSAVAAIAGKPPKAPDPNARALPNPDDRARIKSIADVARKHAAAAPEEHVLQIGDIYIAVTAPATVATRVLSAALAVLGAPA